MYYLFFKDVHNYCITEKVFKEVFSEEFLNYKAECPKNFEWNNFRATGSRVSMNLPQILIGCKSEHHWRTRNFPKTFAENKQIFCNYIELCKKFNVLPIVTLFPTTWLHRESISKERIDELISILEEYQKIYKFHIVNKLNFDEEMSFKDFDNPVHMNINGAKKFSTYMNDYIMNLERNK